MADTVYKIALAAFMHDIGKFAQRAGLDISQDYINKNSILYQPLYKGYYSHKHVLYTAAFIEQFKNDLPSEVNNPDWGSGDSFINLAASHHKPETPMQWIVAIADRISSGLDRDTFERYNQCQDVKDYQKTRMVSVLEEISINNPSTKELHFRYPLKPFTPEDIFPLSRNEAEPDNNIDAEKEYELLFNDFLSDLKALYHKDFLNLWIEHFDSLYQHYTSFIPAATVGDIIPDVSLYDHSKTTAALAAALYLYHRERGDIEDIESIKDYSQKKFLFITGDFYGIQEFIFSKGGSTQKAAAKLLRGRSFYISLLTELASDLLCRAIGLPPLSVVLSAAGKFTIISHNAESTYSAIEKVKRGINDWFHKYFFSESSIGIATLESSPEELTSQRFPVFWQKLTTSVNSEKYKRLDLKRHAGVINGYLNRFNNDLPEPLCSFCGKRPSEMTYNQEGICSVCSDHILIGKSIVKENPRIAVTEVHSELHGSHTLLTIFDKYNIFLDVSGELNSVAKDGSLLRYWDLTIHTKDKHNLKLTRKSINNYIPRHPKIDELGDDYIDKLLVGEKSDRKKDDLFDEIRQGGAKSFYHIAKESLIEKEGQYYGVEAINIFKADIDNLGLIFATGLRDSEGKSRITISRLATLSRLVNAFFTVYLPSMIKTNEKFKDLYTVFAGGDDLFLIGPWTNMIEFAVCFHKDFKRYFCNNPDFTISAGMVMAKPDYPVQAVSSISEKALEEAKGDKNCLNFFRVNVKWDNIAELLKIHDKMEELLDTGVLTRVMIYKMNEIVSSIETENRIMKAINQGKSISMEDVEALKWRALLRYHLTRNIAKTVKDKQKRADMIKELTEVCSLWFETYRDQMRLPLWSLLYETRR